MRTELSLKRDYCIEWGMWEGIREFIQNAMDEEDSGSSVGYDYNPGKSELVIRNTGDPLPLESLLMGESVKRSPQARGRFGEGYKVGALALLRNGCKVSFLTGKEKWTFGFAASKHFGGKEILVVDIDAKKSVTSGVEVKIEGVSQEIWELVQDRIIPLLRRRLAFKGEPLEIIDTPSGSIISHACCASKLFCKGIYIQDLKEDYRFGYDIPSIRLDRDRGIAASWDVKWQTRSILDFAAAKNAIAPRDVFDLVVKGSSDLDVDSNTAKIYCKSLCLATSSEFKSRYGDDAVPVISVEGIREVERFGSTPVVVSPTTLSFLDYSVSKLEDLRVRRRADYEQLVQPSELSHDEREALDFACGMLGVGLPGSESRVVVVVFRDANMLGMFLPDFSMVYIAKKCLTDRWLTLRTLVHEFAHAEGGDLDQKHESAMHDIWCKIVVALSGQIDALKAGGVTGHGC
jgi:hypothetical protein